MSSLHYNTIAMEVEGEFDPSDSVLMDVTMDTDAGADSEAEAEADVLGDDLMDGATYVDRASTGTGTGAGTGTGTGTGAGTGTGGDSTADAARLLDSLNLNLNLNLDPSVNANNPDTVIDYYATLANGSANVDARPKEARSRTWDTVLVDPHDKSAPDPWLQPCGRVVRVVESAPVYEAVGALSLVNHMKQPRPQAQGHGQPMPPRDPPYAQFTALDRRVPKLFIPYAQVAKEYKDLPHTLTGRLFTALLVEWRASDALALGKLVADVGPASSIEAQTLAILRGVGRFDVPLSSYWKSAVNVGTGTGTGAGTGEGSGADAEAESSATDIAWPPDVQKEAASLEKRLSDARASTASTTETLNDRILQALKGPNDTADRRDLRHLRIFTIDPATARDLDDAVHIRPVNGDGRMEVGVHIADVSHYVRPSTPLDRVARQFGTTTYLIQQIAPMLPRILSEQLCSLNPGEPRLAFSAIWVLDSEARVLSEWFGRTIIQSRAKLSYEDAQAVLDGDSNATERLAEKIQTSSTTAATATATATAEGEAEAEAVAVAADISGLWKLAKKLRDMRFRHGALRLDNVKLSFDMDEYGRPLSSTPQVRKDANSLIEEWMLLANIATARQILMAWPHNAMLRRHPTPKDRILDSLVTDLAKEGIVLDTTSSGSFYASIQSLYATHPDPERAVAAVTNMATKPMCLAEYFCVDDVDEFEDYRHYALSVGYYTHFTSPIRRYADIVVHRMLNAALTKKPLVGEVPPVSEVSAIAQSCNQRKLASKRAQEASQHLFLTHMLDGRVARTKGIVQSMGKKSMTVLIQQYGLEQRVYLDDVPWAREYQLHKRVTDRGDRGRDRDTHGDGDGDGGDDDDELLCVDAPEEMWVYRKGDAGSGAQAPIIIRFLDVCVVELRTRKRGVTWDIHAILCPPGVEAVDGLIEDGK